MVAVALVQPPPLLEDEKMLAWLVVRLVLDGIVVLLLEVVVVVVVDQILEESHTQWLVVMVVLVLLALDVTELEVAPADRELVVVLVEGWLMADQRGLGRLARRLQGPFAPAPLGRRRAGPVVGLGGSGHQRLAQDEIQRLEQLGRLLVELTQHALGELLELAVDQLLAARRRGCWLGRARRRKHARVAARCRLIQGAHRDQLIVDWTNNNKIQSN